MFNVHPILPYHFLALWVIITDPYGVIAGHQQCDPKTRLYVERKVQFTHSKNMF